MSNNGSCRRDNGPGRGVAGRGETWGESPLPLPILCTYSGPTILPRLNRKYSTTFDLQIACCRHGGPHLFFFTSLCAVRPISIPHHSVPTKGLLLFTATWSRNVLWNLRQKKRNPSLQSAPHQGMSVLRRSLLGLLL